MRNRAWIIGFILVLVLVCLAGCSPSPGLLLEPGTPIPPTPTPSEVEPEPEPETETVQTPLAAALDPTQPPGAAADLAAELEGLSLSDFFETSFRTFLMRSPEAVLSAGLSDVYGLTAAQLDDISAAYQQETYQLKAVVLEMLERFDRAGLTPADQVSYDIYHWYLEDQLARQEFMVHDYPATFFPPTAVHEDLLQFFTDIHPVRDLNDAQAYVTRLGLAANKIDQLIENLEIRRQAGITPPQFAIQWSTYGTLGQFVETPTRETRLYTAFQEKMMPLSSIHPDDQQALLDQAEETIQDEILPAYRKLWSYLNDLETYSGADSGVWRLPQGQAYYTTLLRHYTTTDLPAEEIHQTGLTELQRIHVEMRAVFAQLGYPLGESLIQSYDRVAQDGGLIPGNEVLAVYENLIAEAGRNLETAFDIRPAAEVIVIQDPFGGYYIPGSIDGTRPGAFYAGVGEPGQEFYAMPTLAYHETIPGHHFQISLAQEREYLPSFRRGFTYTAFSEGWALYAEHLAWELGWYADDPYGYLGFLQAQAFRAARLVVDTGLHAKGWTFEQAQDFFSENTGFQVGDSVNPQHQVARYLVWPGQSVSYYVGYLKIMELRQKAKEELGDQFDLKEFHRVVLSNGSMPLEILERVIDQYIQDQMGS